MTDVVVVGSFVQDLGFSTDQFPSPGETRIGTFVAGPGGKGFNQAVASHRLSASTLFVGAVGRDPFAESLYHFAAEEGLSIAVQEVEGHQTGAASIVVNRSGQNLIVVALGANAALSPRFVEEQEASICRAKVLVTQLECSLEASRRALKLARGSGVTALLNPAPINDGCDRSLLALADVLIPNESEAAFILQKLFHADVPARIDCCSDEELRNLCSRFGVPQVVITLGARGCFYWSASRSLRVPAVAVNTIDTTGAGDCFCGALAAGLVRYNHDMERAIQFANHAAALSTERKGTAPAMPTARELEARFR